MFIEIKTVGKTVVGLISCVHERYFNTHKIDAQCGVEPPNFVVLSLPPTSLDGNYQNLIDSFCFCDWDDGGFSPLGREVTAIPCCGWSTS